MIRVVISLAALTLMPLLAIAEEPAGTNPADRAFDSYYQKRSLAAVTAAAGSAQNPDASRTQHIGTSTPTADAAAVTTSAAIPRQPLTPQAAGYSYYRQRQVAQEEHEAERARLAQYMSETPTYNEGEEVPSGPYAVDGQGTFDGSYPSGDGSYETVPSEGGPIAGSCGPDGCAGDGCVNGCGNPGCDGNCTGLADPGFRLGSFCAAYSSVPTTNVLWNELYSCRCMWTSFDYLGFWGKGAYVPALVTTSPIGTPQSSAGLLGQPTTTILFGNQRVDNEMRSGGQVTIGGWLVGDVLGVEGSYFNLDTATTDYTATSIFSNGSTNAAILARPYFNPAPPILVPPPPHPQLPPAESAALIAYPNFNLPTGGTADLDGGIRVATASSAQSGGFLVRRLASVDLMADRRMFFLFGYRFFRLQEGLLITDHTQVIGGGIPADSGFTHLDSFGTKNIFNGLDLGLSSDVRRGRWVFETRAKLALGDMYQLVDIDGGTIVRTAGVETGYAGGVLTQGSNIGKYRRNQFTLIPDLMFKVGYQLTPGLRLTAGYNFMYVTRVARPGNQVDMVVNPPYTPGATQIVQRPTYFANPTDFWLQGFQVGFDFRF